MIVATLFKSVLLVEDDSAHALLIKRALKNYVENVRHESSVAAGLQALSQFAPELVITDLNLPDSRGLTHVERLKESSNDTPIVVLTSSNSIQDAVSAMRLGARDFVVKNFDNNFSEVLGLSLSRLCATLLIDEERKKLEREMNALRLAIESSQDGMAVVDSKGAVSYANSAFRSVVELCGGDARNLLASFTAKVKEQEALVKELAENLEKLSPGAVWSSELHFVENKEMAFSMSLSVIPPLHQDRAAEPQPNKTVVWFRDISERKRREKFQREILSATTHDLKGPLGTISLCAEMLQDAVAGQEKASQLVLRVASSSKGALNLIDEFLSARRIEEGTFILKPLPVDVLDLLRNVVADYAAIAKAKSIELSCEETLSKLEVKVDKLGLSRVIGNLLSNAIKFTPKLGRVKVWVKALGSDYAVVVEDSGTGMEPASVHKIFERYSRLAEHKGIEGTGLGLFVVKSIVTAHGGKIQVTSKVGEGTRFTVILPCDPPVNERGEVVSLDFR